MSQMSLKWRIGLSLCLLLSVTLCVLCIVAYVELKNTLTRDVDTRLLADVRTVMAVLNSGMPKDQARQEIHAFLNPNSGQETTRYRIWFDRLEVPFAGSDSLSLQWQTQLNLPATPPDTGTHMIWPIQEGYDTYRLIWSHAQSADDTHPVHCLIIEPVAHIDQQMALFIEVLIPVGLSILLFILGITVLLVHWILKPVTTLTHHMNTISAEHLQTATPALHHGPEELSPFITAWNDMIDRLKKAMLQQQQFTADASHELRTPLAILKSTLQLARQRSRPAKMYENAIDQALEDLGRLEHLTDELLTLARLDNINEPVPHTPLDLETLVLEICLIHKPLAKAHNTTLSWQTSSVEVMGHEPQLKRMLTNLIDNAIKFGPQGGTVTVTLSQLNETAVIKVHDQGGNLPENQQTHLFDRFYRVTDSQGNERPGSGLGLALVKEIAEKHHGAVAVTSHPITGTEFTVTLPTLSRAED